MTYKRTFGVYWIGAITKGWVLGANGNPIRYTEDEAKAYVTRWNPIASNGSFVIRKLDEL